MSRTCVLIGVSLLVGLTRQVQAQNPTADEAAIRSIESAWDAANLKGDAGALDRLLDSRFIMTGDDGKVHPKAEVLSELRSRRIVYESARTEELKVFLHGNAAVANGRWRGSYTNRGKKIELVERFTNFYVRSGANWVCVASHGSSIRN